MSKDRLSSAAVLYKISTQKKKKLYVVCEIFTSNFFFFCPEPKRASNIARFLLLAVPFSRIVIMVQFRIYVLLRKTVMLARWVHEHTATTDGKTRKTICFFIYLRVLSFCFQFSRRYKWMAVGGPWERSGKFNEISITKPKTVEACEREQTNGGGGKKNNVVVERRTKEEMARARRMDDDGEKKGKKLFLRLHIWACDIGWLMTLAMHRVAPASASK